MENLEEYNIKLENSNKEGMINVNAINNFTQKAKEAVCEISLSKGFGTGFFCKIPYTEDNNLLLPVLITNNHVLSKENLESKNDIKIIINSQPKTIPLKKRKIWTDEKMDFTFIEIKEKEDNIETFFNLDDNVLKRNCPNERYLEENVLIFGINKNDNNQLSCSFGFIKKCEDCFFVHTCNTYEGCSGGCIVNKANNCVIGIHRGEIKIKNNVGNKKPINQGIFLRDIIKGIKESKFCILQGVIKIIHILLFLNSLQIIIFVIII